MSTKANPIPAAISRLMEADDMLEKTRSEVSSLDGSERAAVVYYAEGLADICDTIAKEAS